MLTRNVLKYIKYANRAHIVKLSSIFQTQHGGKTRKNFYDFFFFLLMFISFCR